MDSGKNAKRACKSLYIIAGSVNGTMKMRNYILVLAVFILSSLYTSAQTSYIDSLATIRIAELNKLKPVFKAQKRNADSAFASLYSDVYNVTSVVKRGATSKTLGQEVMYCKSGYPGNAETDFVNAKIDDVIGPYVTGNSAGIYKVKWKGLSEDSAMARHILIAYRGAERAAPEVKRSRAAAKVLADSLLKVITSGKTKMVDLLMSFTDDNGSKSGNLGNYGWFTRGSGFVKEFKDASFNNPVGTVVVFETQFGFHILEVVGYVEKKYCVKAIPLERLIDPEINYQEQSIAKIVMPVYPGGIIQFRNYLKDSLHYPASALEKRQEGKVEITFRIGKDGTISDITNVKAQSENPEFIAEAKRLISAMPPWKPAQFKEQQIDWIIKVVIPFRLDD